MAIEKTYFTSTSNYASMAEIYDWLGVNATDYFTSFSKTEDDSGNVTQIDCYVGTERKAYFVVSTGIWLHAICSNGTDCNVSGNDVHSVNYFSYAIKTSQGILLSGAASSNAYRVGQIITKTNNGDIFAAVFGTQKGYFKYVDAGNSTGIVQFTTSVNNGYSYTALANVCTTVGSYAPGLFVPTFAQFTGELAITADGNEYYQFYNVVLKA